MDKRETSKFRQSVERRASLHSMCFQFCYGMILSGAAPAHYAQRAQVFPLGVVILLVAVMVMIVIVALVRTPRLARRYEANPRTVVKEIIEDWNPPAVRLESDYEKSLSDFLRGRLRFVKITRQYGDARVKCDLAVGKDVMIELEAGFRSAQELQRLIGQVGLYHREWGKPVFVVLLGETEQYLLEDLRRSLHNYDEVEVVTKDL